MNERTATPRQGDSTETPDRYSTFTPEQFDVGIQWLRNQGTTPWMARLQIVGDEVRADLRGMPPVVRHMLRDQFAALELMTAEQIRDYLSRDTVGRIERVETVLTEAGR